ncbi:MAG TPA: DUF2911 domain-containing protein [Flavisolibacter sp.]|jgi:opacity protein-like surface antigen|nr:DUF2911 domain-containing protein [Flavisolibacter sp.]
MKRILALAVLASTFLAATSCNAQDKSKRPSPPAKVSQKIASGATISVDYSQPSLKGRTIGKDVEPMKGQAWRMGANEATVFETDKDVTINGQALPAGKYSVFGIAGDTDFTVIFNKAWKVWGTEYEANKAQDVLKVAVKPTTASASQEKLTYTIDPSGKVSLLWGNQVISFDVK